MEDFTTKRILEEIQLLKEEIKNIKEHVGIKQEQKRIVVEIPKTPQVNPRQGNYTSADVAIEKFFYYGKR